MSIQNKKVLLKVRLDIKLCNKKRTYHRMVTICQSWVHLMHWHGVHTGHLMFLFPFHPPILKPDLYLSFCQTQCMCNLDPTMLTVTFETPSKNFLAKKLIKSLPASSCKISIEVKLFFQFQRLVPCVRCPLSLSLTILINCI